ncbi:hypothetical protein Tco_1403520 [Tanacetum coccineum]
MTRATPQQRAYLEKLANNKGYNRTTGQYSSAQCLLDSPMVFTKTTSKRPDYGVGITWFLPQQQQQQQQQLQPSPPPQQPPVVAQIVNVELDPDFLQKLDAQLLAEDAISELNAGNWSALFPFMVAKEEIVKVFPLLDPSDGSLNLIYKEFRLTTPTYAKRKVNILRACKHVHEGALAVVEVTWVEHMGVSEINRGGIGFGAKVMLDLLERSCEKKRGRFSQTIVKVFELLQECERDLERALLLTSKDFQDGQHFETFIKATIYLFQTSSHLIKALIFC